MPEISVIIPTYNRLAFLREAINSVLAQSFRDYELIVVDDGSTDETALYLKSLGQSLRWVRQDNAGPSAARNHGIRLAQGALLAFLDSDDLWVAQKLAKQVGFMRENADAALCYTDEIWIRRGVRVNQKRKHHKYSGWIFERCIPLCIVSPSSVMMRKTFFEQVGVFDEHLPACEDYDLWLRGALHFPFHFLPERLIVKRGGHADQLSAAWGLDAYRTQALQKILLDPRLNEAQRLLVLQHLVRLCRILEIGFRKNGNTEMAAHYLRLGQKVAVD